jgi:hypothetical protein
LIAAFFFCGRTVSGTFSPILYVTPFFGGVEKVFFDIYRALTNCLLSLYQGSESVS